MTSVEEHQSEVSAGSGPSGSKPRRRFLQLSDVMQILDVSAYQAYALVRTGDLPAIKIGGRGQWRVEEEVLEAWIQRKAMQTKELTNPSADDSVA